MSDGFMVVVIVRKQRWVWFRGWGKRLRSGKQECEWGHLRTIELEEIIMTKQNLPRKFSSFIFVLTLFPTSATPVFMPDSCF